MSALVILSTDPMPACSFRHQQLLIDTLQMLGCLWRGAWM